MIKINILSRFDRDRFYRQLDIDRFPASEYYIKENSTEDVIWDLVLVFEGLNNPHKVNVKEGGLIFISGEPPAFCTYPHGFTQQFDWVISSHEKIQHKHLCLMQQALNWHYSYNRTIKSYNKEFYEIRDMPIPIKSKPISIITSNQKLLPGHSRRIRLIETLLKKYGEYIDLYGKGFKYIDDKAEALDDYYFHICIENSNVNHYWTEKIADPLLAYTVPIYVGAPNIGDYFDTEGMINCSIDDENGISSIIESIIRDPEGEFTKRLEKLTANRNKILHEYNIYPYIINFYKKNIVPTDKTKTTIIHKPEDYSAYKILQFITRIKRFVYKQRFNLLH